MTRRPTIDVLGLSPELRDLFCSTAHPRERLPVARRLLYDEGSLVDALGPLIAEKDAWGFSIEQAVRLDGYEVRAMQQGWGLFNPTRRAELTAWCFRRFDEERIDERIEEALLGAGGALELPARLSVFVVPADPANHNLMVHCGGLSCAGVCWTGPPAGGRPGGSRPDPDAGETRTGHIALQIWPDDGNLERLEAVLRRAALRGAAWGRNLPATVADHLEIEAAVAARLDAEGWLPPRWRPTPWCVALASPPGHRETLDTIAGAYGQASYDELRTNVYGNELGADDFGGELGDGHGPGLDLPAATVLDVDDLAYSREVLADPQLLRATDPRTVAAALFGDPAVRRYGHAALGLSRWAGLEVAFRDRGTPT